MLKRSRLLTACWMLITLGFGLGVLHLFELRFEAGDIYPAYSSLRSDPLGTRVFYDSLRRLDGIRVERNMRPLSKVRFAPDTTLFYMAAPYSEEDSVPAEFLRVFDRLTTAGGRLVMTFFPERDRSCPDAEADISNRDCNASPKADTGAGPFSGRESEAGEKNGPGKGSPNVSPDADEHPAYGHGKRMSIREHWGIDADIRAAGGAVFGLPAGRTAVTDLPGLPPRISWHSSLFFNTTGTPWRTIYTCDGNPVVVEKQYRNGSVVLATDSFFISNEALYTERHPAFLAWLIGGNQSVLIDESHLGITRQPGLIDFMRRTRLHWLLVPVVMVALLFVWRNSIPFPPSPRSEPENGINVRTQGRHSAHGLTSLLRRNIPQKDILRICVREWEGSLQFLSSVSRRARRRIQAVAGSTGSRSGAVSDPVRGYRLICRILSEEKRNE